MKEKDGIKGNHDGENGHNDSYTVNNKIVPRNILVEEVKGGLHPGYHIFHNGNEEYIRSNPDHSSNNNINK